MAASCPEGLVIPGFESHDGRQQGSKRTGGATSARRRRRRTPQSRTSIPSQAEALLIHKKIAAGED